MSWAYYAFSRMSSAESGKIRVKEEFSRLDVDRFVCHPPNVEMNPVLLHPWFKKKTALAPFHKLFGYFINL